MTTQSDNSDQAMRRRWMSTLAKTPAPRLAAAVAALTPPTYTTLRAPETGLVMVRGRAGGTGQRFNLGEISVTRCALRLQDGTVGHAYIAGRDHRKAERAALLDALLQLPDFHTALMRDLIEPLERELARARDAASRKAAATRVEFFTMAREDAP